MAGKRAALAIFAAHLVAASATFAQQTPQSGQTEFGRGSGGEIEAMMKHANTISGSVGVALSRSSLPFASGSNARTYQGTLGGVVVKDRLWFFGSAQMSEGLRFEPRLSSASTRATPVIALGKMTALMGDRQDFTAFVGRGLPSSFLSLHYTGIVSSSMFFTANVSRQSVSQPRFLTIGRMP